MVTFIVEVSLKVTFLFFLKMIKREEKETQKEEVPFDTARSREAGHLNAFSPLRSFPTRLTLCWPSFVTKVLGPLLVTLLPSPMPATSTVADTNLDAGTTFSTGTPETPKVRDYPPMVQKGG
ncbi:hypothetical protein NDU88_011342 [Pleurodeles waltl]|uniref:Uncharacterized protein n=1 Tax=Pleurodeles waltl TaxID=8319 RepID=A0AAV7QYI5_PLEWA|nr:hypothetical protein NDU88_011342 [Pleurodeles waltl]